MRRLRIAVAIISYYDTIAFVPAPQNITPYRPVPSHYTPIVGDILFYERVNHDSAQWCNPPPYNSAHPNTEQWPNYVLVYVEPDDTPGWERWFYVKDPQNQDTYNFESSLNLQNEWPKLTQTYLIERALFTGPGHTTGIVAPPAFNRVWTRMGDDEVRIGTEKLDSRYVVFRVFYEDISHAIYRQRIDDESGQIVIVEMRKVPVGTAAQKADATGYITEIAPINIDWSLSTKDKVSSLIGAGIRNYTIHRPFPWPPVLLNLQIRLNVDGSFGYDYSMKRWNGLCKIDVSHYWSLTPPAIGDPSLMGGTAIRWNGALININIEECLHPFVQITESLNGNTVWRNFPATPFVDWETTQVTYPSVQPCPKGGYLIERWTVYSPIGLVG